MSCTLWIPLKEGIGGARMPTDRGEDRVTLRITLLYQGVVKCFESKNVTWCALLYMHALSVWCSTICSELRALT
jgi:hypothetical protein